MTILSLKGKINILTGLHIGGGDDTMKIGGIDNQVIKDPLTKLPYIPGSSLKGKMRSLLEWEYTAVGSRGGDVFDSNILKKNENSIIKKDDAKILLKLFGDKTGESGITRISVGDCFLSDELQKKYENNEIVVKESKYENVIDRSTGTTKRGGLRQSERVPAGLSFDFDIRVKVLDGDDENALKAMVERGLELVEKDYLGGSGSRGYGRVEFSNKTNWE